MNLDQEIVRLTKEAKSYRRRWLVACVLLAALAMVSFWDETARLDARAAKSQAASYLGGWRQCVRDSASGLVKDYAAPRGDTPTTHAGDTLPINIGAPGFEWPAGTCSTVGRCYDKSGEYTLRATPVSPSRGSLLEPMRRIDR